MLLLPTVPTTFTRAEIAEEPVARNLVLGRYTQFANLLDLAAVAVPGRDHAPTAARSASPCSAPRSPRTACSPPRTS